ncbi:hypothetical protein Poli38472_006045 [Pythium oligandrum]|uniref:Uncharacterized protein n=1 Tax=Pythium oligandrum TaxID=41045 RepID=A0A8K1CTN5_PYTOL|nr:hypothetical protein Poli38472_006045 [Pythium oligandrum]|eukprot:TMW68577.1 hypothetical protein Poli38472_006045 [Pythium oligandrum]
MKNNRTAGESNEKLGKFLLEASTDSLLSEYVERKLRQSREHSIPVTSDNEKRRGSRIPPSVMEPPPSLSSSTVSSLRSSLADSILNRTANQVVGGKEDTVVRESSSMLSTAERNYAEIEKLRLSQRLREVNNVQAWMKWRDVVISDRLLAQARKREQMEVERAVAAAQRQHQEAQLSKQDEHELEVESLHEQIRAQEQAQKEKEERDRQQKEEERRHQSEEAVARGAKRTRVWSQLVEAHLEDCLVQADKRINDVDTKLEALLELMDVDVSSARFQAASFLVNAMLEQKVENANAHVQAQQELMQGLNARSAYPDDSIVDSHINKTDGKEKHQQWQERMPTKNARFLLDMVRQRVTRLHQLHQAIARLAATVSTPNMSAATDSARLHHAAFLTDVMHERALQHLEGMLDIHYKRSLLDLPLTTTETAPLPARRF